MAFRKGWPGEKPLMDDGMTMASRKDMEKRDRILAALDELYGTEKEGFPHEADWQLLCAIMLSAQSTDKQVEAVLPELYERFPRLSDLAKAPPEEIQAAIRSIGLCRVKARNMKACCGTLLSEYGGKVPKSLEELIKLPGVGRKTATLFLADTYGIPGVTVDTHVFRISHRLGWAEGNTPAKVEQELMAFLPREHWNRINFQLIYLGRSVCTARRVKCGECPLRNWCARKI